MRVESCCRRVAPSTAVTSAGSWSRRTTPELTASSRSWALYAERSAQLTTAPSGVAGVGSDHEWLRMPSRVSRQRLRGVSTTSAPQTAWW